MYKIKNATVSRNKLFLLNDIQQIDYTPNSPFQVLMGANGSGKSTLLRLLTAYSPDANEFHKGGSFRQTIQADGVEYVVGYDVNGGIRYTFSCDGQELNEGGTREVYRNLWAEELNITQTAVNLLTGKYRLSRMRPAERQELFSTVTGANMTVGFAAFDKLRKRANGVKGAIKEDESLLVKLRSQQITPDEVEVLQGRVEEYRQLATRYLQQYRNDIDGITEEEVKRILTGVASAKLKLKELLRNPVVPADAPNEISAERELQEMTSNLAHLDEWQRGMLEQFNELDDLHQRLMATANVGNRDLTEEGESLRNTIATYLGDMDYREDLVYDDPTGALRQLGECLASWQQVVVAFTGGISPTQVVLDIQRTEQDLSNYNRGIGQLESAIEAQETHVKHLQVHQDDNCAKCGYSASGEAREASIKAAGIRIAEFNERLAKGRAAKEHAETELTRLREYRTQLHAILSVEQRYPMLSTFFGELFSKTDVFDNGGELVTLSNRLYHDLQIKAGIRQAETRLAEIDRITAQLQAQSIGSLESLMARMSSTRERYEEYFANYCAAKTTVEIYRGTLNGAKRYHAELFDALGLYVSMLDSVRWAVDAMFNAMCVAAYTDYDEAAKLIETQLQGINDLEARIRGTEDHLAEMKAKHGKLLVLIAAMSPSTGLLAKCAVRPVEQFIEQMNTIIERVWTHELTVLPYKRAEQVKLDYILPMRVAGRDTIVPDISEGSDGQLEIVDFAFTIVALMRLGNKGIPLMLDETDRPLQPEHKENLMVFLREMVEAGWFSQIFVISHHISAYSALPQADIIELAPVASHPGANACITFQ